MKKHPGKPLQAAALSYQDQGMEAPQVEVFAERQLAKTLLRVARRYGIPVENSDQLVKGIAEQAERNEIPLELYEIVARLLAKVDNRASVSAKIGAQKTGAVRPTIRTRKL